MTGPAPTAMLVIVNSHHDVVVFALPSAIGGRSWRLLIDTNCGDAEEARTFAFGHEYMVTGLAERPRRPPPASAE